MTIHIHLNNQLIAYALYQLLVTNGYDHVIMSGRSSAKRVIPDVLLVDTTTLSDELLTRYSGAKVLLFDTGMQTEKLCATLLSYRIHGVLSPDTKIQLFKEALAVVSEGQVWIDHASARRVLHDTGAMSRPGRINGITGREQEIVACVCQGLSNKEIAHNLGLSEYTVKCHLNHIFTKLNITSRSRLMTLTMQGSYAGLRDPFMGSGKHEDYTNRHRKRGGTAWAHVHAAQTRSRAV